MKKTLPVLLLFLTLCASLCAATQVSVSASRISVFIGDPVEVRLVIKTHRLQGRVRITSGRPGYEIISEKILPERSMDSHRVIEKIYTLAFFKTGRHSIGPFTVEISGPRGISETGQSRKLDITVKSVLKETDDDIAPIKDLIPVKGSPAHLLPYAAAFVFAVLIIGAAILLFRRSRKSSFAAPPQADPLDEFKYAIEELLGKNLFSKARYKEFCLQLTVIVKRFLSRYYRFNALELTSSETLTALNSLEKNRELNMNFRTLLNLSDLIKFARFLPGSEGERDLRQHIEHILNIYQTRKIREEQNVSAG